MVLALLNGEKYFRKLNSFPPGHICPLIILFNLKLMIFITSPSRCGAYANKKHILPHFVQVDPFILNRNLKSCKAIFL